MKTFARFCPALVGRVRRHGVLATMYALALRAVNRFVPFKVLRGVHVEAVDPGFVDVPGDYSASFLTARALREFSRNQECEMSHGFLEQALGKGDECYGFAGGGALAAYGWYAINATPAVAPGLTLHFSPRHVYMYKGFTSDLHRGKRLHAIGMTRALQYYRSKGYDGIVSYIESTNFDSLRSCARMGYRIFGSIYVVKLFGRYFTFASPGCARFAFRLEDCTSPIQPSTIGST